MRPEFNAQRLGIQMTLCEKLLRARAAHPDATARAEVCRKDGEIARLNKELRVAADEANGFREVVQRNAEEIALLKQRVGDSAQQRSRIARLEEELVSERRALVSAHTREVQSYEQTIAALNLAQSRLKREHDFLRNRIAELESEMVRRCATEADLRGQCERMARDHARARALIADFLADQREGSD
jgi:chromosome segregation ATPase